MPEQRLKMCVFRFPNVPLWDSDLFIVLWNVKSAVLVISCKAFEACFRISPTFYQRLQKNFPTEIDQSPKIASVSHKNPSFGVIHFLKERKDSFKALKWHFVWNYHQTFDLFSCAQNVFLASNCLSDWLFENDRNHFCQSKLTVFCKKIWRLAFSRKRDQPWERWTHGLRRDS